MNTVKYFLMGIGNKQRADDGVGVFIAENFTAPDWFVCNCCTMPENYTSVVKKSKPGYLILVDAANMNLPPGSIRRLSSSQIQDLGLGTHAMPLSLVMEYLKDAVARKTVFIGIQPKVLADREGLSQEVVAAAQEVMTHLRNASFDHIPVL